MTPGDGIWLALAVAWAGWLVVTAAVAGLPSVNTVTRWFLGSWGTRAFALACWAEAGWHLFAQRP